MLRRTPTETAEVRRTVHIPRLTWRDMGLLQAYIDAWSSGNAEAIAELIHDDFVFDPHVGGVTMGKSDLVGFVGNDMVRGEHERVLYENDEVGVMHSIAHFANGSASEAVLSFARFKDGKIVRMETGATPLSEDYTLVGQDD
jgi:ketosteroid isomerase-like protein